ncbi:MAG: HAD hydrolase-like protein [bacterium]|nr:HAD hydrolase-like protein [bacterium]
MGQRLRELIKSKRVSIDRAATIAGVHRTTLFRWLSGEQSPIAPQSWQKGGLENLAGWLGFCDLDELLDTLRSSDEPTRNPTDQLSTAARRVLERVLLQGALRLEDLPNKSGESTASALAECLSAGALVERTIGGSRILYEPALGLLAHLARRSRDLRGLAADLGVPSSYISSIVDSVRNETRVEDGRLKLQGHTYELVVFDWSNTLAEEADFDDAICEALAATCGRDVFRSLLDRLEATQDPRWYDYFYLADYFGIPAERVIEIHEHHRNLLRWIPGARQLFEYCRSQSDIALATNCNAAVLDCRLSLMGLSRSDFEAIYTSDSVSDASSKEDMYRRLLRELSVSPTATIVISDSYERDVLPALRLGCHAIWYTKKTDPSFWGTPAMDVRPDEYHLLRSAATRTLPDLVTVDHAETLAWFQGS